jgi:hypothetical protein
MMLNRTLSIVLAMVAGVSAGSLRAGDDNVVKVSSESMSMFREWSKAFDKVYSTEEDMMDRLKVWLHNHGTLIIGFRKQY